jgi:hypothetical protein
MKLYGILFILIILVNGCTTLEEYTNFGTLSSGIPEGNEKVFISAIKHTFTKLKDTDMSIRNIVIEEKFANYSYYDCIMQFRLFWDVDEYFNIHYDTEFIKLLMVDKNEILKEENTIENISIDDLNIVNSMISNRLKELQRYYWSSKGIYGWSQ